MLSGGGFTLRTSIFTGVAALLPAGLVRVSAPDPLRGSPPASGPPVPIESLALASGQLSRLLLAFDP